MHKYFSSSIATSLLLCLVFSAPAWAKKAEITLVPTRIVMEKGDRYTTLNIRNNGDATGQYTIETVDMIMEEQGVIREAKPGEKVEFSARDSIRVSPRSITLAPGEYQAIRVLVRKPDSVENGEYRTHIKVLMINDNVKDEGKNNANEAAIQVKANLALVIPAIVRYGETSYTATLSDAKLTQDPKTKHPVVQLYIHREGNRSSMADLHVFQESGGKEVEIGTLLGVPVYRPTPRRLVKVYLDVPPGVTLGSGKMKVVYKAQEKEGGKILAEAPVEP